MELIELTPRLHMLRPPFGQLYLWQDPDGITAIDTGVPGSAPVVAEAIRSLGRDPDELRRVVLTHFHPDHTGSAADIRSWGGVSVLAHAADAPVIRGVQAPPEPVLLDWERPLFDDVKTRFGLAGPPVEVDVELSDGDVLDFGDGAQVLSVPGHTDGSIAFFLREHGVLFTGDTIAELEGTALLGFFNTDRDAAISSLRRQAELDTDIVCFGHGEPFRTEGCVFLRAAAKQLL